MSASDYAAYAAYSPMFRYPWAAAVQALSVIAPAKDGSRTMRYTNPLTGGPVLSTLDCHLVGLERASDTISYRTNTNTVCVVVEGDGRSRVGASTIEWTKNDIFSLPHDHWISHRATSANAKLFQVSDREILRRLDLLREEVRE